MNSQCSVEEQYEHGLGSQWLRMLKARDGGERPRKESLLLSCPAAVTFVSKVHKTQQMLLSEPPSWNAPQIVKYLLKWQSHRELTSGQPNFWFKDCPKSNPRAVALNQLGPWSLWGLQKLSDLSNSFLAKKALFFRSQHEANFSRKIAQHSKANFAEKKVLSLKFHKGKLGRKLCQAPRMKQALTYWVLKISGHFYKVTMISRLHVPARCEWGWNGPICCHWAPRWIPLSHCIWKTSRAKKLALNFRDFWVHHEALRVVPGDPAVLTTEVPAQWQQRDTWS